MPETFDVEAARQSGYSDDDILNHLIQSRSFDVDGALKSGYTKQDIINHLSAAPTQGKWFETPLVSLPKIGGSKTGIAGAASGIASSLSKTAEGLTTPESIGTLGALGLSHFFAPPLAIMADIGFTAKMAHDLYKSAPEQIPEIIRRYREGDTKGAFDLGTSLLTQAATVAAGTYGIGRSGGAKSLRPPKPPNPLEKGVDTILGRLTGRGSEAVAEASKATPEFKAAMRGGKSEIQVLNDVRDAVSNLDAVRKADYVAKMRELPQDIKIDLAPVRARLKELLKNYGVVEAPNYGEYADAFANLERKGIKLPDVAKKLDFGGSAVAEDAAVIQKIYNDIMQWGERPNTDLSPMSVDTLKRRLNDYYAPSSGARAIATELKSQVRDLLDTNVPGYKEMTKDYHASSQLLDEIQNELKTEKRNGTSIRRLSKLMGENTEYGRTLLDALQQYTPTNLKGEIAGMSMHPLEPNYIGTMGGALGVFYGHPGTLALTALTSPRAVGETMVALSKLKNSVAPTKLAALPAGMQAASKAKPKAAPSEPEDENAIEGAVKRFSLPAPPPYFGPPASPIETLARKYGVRQ